MGRPTHARRAPHGETRSTLILTRGWALAFLTVLLGLGVYPGTELIGEAEASEGGWQSPPIAVGQPLPQAFLDGRRYAAWPEVRRTFLGVHGEREAQWPAPVRAFVQRRRHKLIRDLAQVFSSHYFRQRPWPDVYKRFRPLRRPGNEEAMAAFLSEVELPTDKARELHAEFQRPDPIEWLRLPRSRNDETGYGARIPRCRLADFVAHAMISQYWIARLDVHFSTYSGRPEHNELAHARDTLEQELFLTLWKSRRFALAVALARSTFTRRLWDKEVKPRKDELEQMFRREVGAPLHATPAVSFSYDHCTGNWHLAPATPPETIDGKPRSKGCGYDVIEWWRYEFPTLTWGSSAPGRPRSAHPYALEAGGGLMVEGGTQPEEPGPWAVHEVQGRAIYVLVTNPSAKACPEKQLRPGVPCEVPARLIVYPDGRPDYRYEIGLPQIPRQAGAGAQGSLMAQSWAGPASIARRIGAMWLEACLTGLRSWVDQVGEPFDADGAWWSPDLTMKPTPGEVVADGQTQVRLLIEASVTEHGRRGTRTRPMQGVGVSLRIGETGKDGAALGTLSSERVSTDASGRASVVYTVPTASALTSHPYDWVSIVGRGDVEGRALEAYATVRFETSEGEVFVEPHPSATAFSSKGLIPADSRFPASIAFYLKDDQGCEQPNRPVVFRLTTPSTEGELQTLDGARRGASLEVTTDENGHAQVLYVYRGEGRLEAPLLEEITVSGRDGGRVRKAHVSVGMDLVAKAVTNGYANSGEVGAGEDVPLRIVVEDRFHRGAPDLSMVFSHWGSGGAHGTETLWAQLDVVPATQVPDYMMGALRLEVHPSRPLHARMRLLRDPKSGACVLRASAASALTYEGWPRVRPPVAGRHLYRVSVGLAASSGGLLSGQADPRPVQYVTIPVGMPADAMTIFLFEDPFSAHTPEQAFLRAVVEKAGFGDVLALTEYAAMLNRGDIEAMARKALEDRLDWLEGKAGEIPGLQNVTDLLGVASAAEEYTTAALEWAPKQPAHGPPIQGFKKRLIDGLMEKLRLKNKRLVIVTGDGEQGVRDTVSGDRLPAENGKWRVRGDGKSYSVKNGPVTVFLVDKDMDLAPTGSAKLEEHE